MGDWSEILASVTTPFGEQGGVDLASFRKHLDWLLASGIRRFVIAGAFGEGSTLSFEERLDLFRTATEAVEGAGRVIATVGDAATRRAVRMASEAEAIGCRALVVETPHGTSGSWRETRAHLAEVLSATSLPCALENHPRPGAIDLVPEQIAELHAGHPGLVAVIDGTGDARRISELRARAGERLAILSGDAIVLEGLRAGATGWLSGLANALPAETSAWLELARADDPRTAAMHAWLLPLLRLESRPDAIQALKQLLHEVGRGAARVRPPRLPLPPAEHELLARELRAALSASGAELAGTRWKSPA